MNDCKGLPEAVTDTFYTALLLHLIIRIDKVVVLILVIVVPKLLVSLGEVDGLAARARAVDDVRCLDLLHVVLVGLLGCFHALAFRALRAFVCGVLVRSAAYLRVLAKSWNI